MMRDEYYNHMLREVLGELKEMVAWNEPKTMVQFKICDPKAWEKTMVQVEGLYKYDDGGYPDRLMTYFNDQVYPVITTGMEMKKGFKKVYAIKIDDFDFRMLLSGCESLIY